ncbi:uncharacterized protein [Dermacentor andersoni]|uniref:uncharacterized protein isoform X2 n=1 Tax=Dermacentor andersoni TaxID=34620 RepID=UPI002416B041|nr:uncharacterized protein LOC129380795 isoform X2 [Dermacentor andersoni]
MHPRATAHETMESYYPLFAISDGQSNNYLTSANGILAGVELCLGLGVFVGMFARAKTNCSQKFLFATGLSYGLNDLNIVLTSLVSHETASFLPTVFYYLMYQFTAMISFTSGGILSLITGHSNSRPKFQACLLQQLKLQAYLCPA